MSRLLARWIGRRRTLDGGSLVDRPVSGLAHSPVSGILRAHVVEPGQLFASEEMGTDYSWYVGSPSTEMLVIKQIMVVNVTDSAVDASLGLSTTPEASGIAWTNSYLLWLTSIAARSYFLWDGICPLEDMWIYGMASAADSLIFSAWGQYADFYE